MLPPHLAKEAAWLLEFLASRQATRVPQLKNVKHCSDSCFYCSHPEFVRKYNSDQFELASFQNSTEQFGLSTDTSPAGYPLQASPTGLRSKLFDLKSDEGEPAEEQYSTPNPPNTMIVPQEEPDLLDLLAPSGDTVESPEESHAGWEVLEKYLEMTRENSHWDWSSVPPSVGSDTEIRTDDDDESVLIGAIRWSQGKPMLPAETLPQKACFGEQSNYISAGTLLELEGLIL
ncbi:hypothetical protein TWF506_006415 [Arthrobotrys conoides]|uniref:Uncharacterized protein n=1 Tax=Arthrobotrys conoides TaxID=74498 RepID=A0AAN8PL07_9PEZI